MIKIIATTLLLLIMGCVSVRFCGETITTNCKPMKPDNKSGAGRGLVEFIGTWEW